MSDLRKAAEKALKLLENAWGIGDEATANEWVKTQEALRQALAQPKREWVGLTDEELEPMCDDWRIVLGSYVHDFAKAIEAKLKEKNA